MWPEVKTAKQEKRRELVLSGSEIAARIQQQGLDDTIFKLTDLNYLSLTDTSLSELSPEIANLNNLQTLILHSNSLGVFEKAICSLSKLKILDLSRNGIVSVPDTVSQLDHIVSINLSGNKLESFPTIADNSKLTVLDLSYNNLSKFPDICNGNLAILSDVRLQGNQIEDIPNGIAVLPSLKVLDVSSNKIKLVPGELADCHKLKDLNLKSNPITDRRLLKLIDQCRTKQVLDYVKEHCVRSENVAPKKGKKTGKSKQKSDEEESIDEASYKYHLVIKPASDNFNVTVENSTKNIREHILCCIINNVAFTEDIFKNFIKMQNRIHDGVCQKRTLATLATHDLRKLASSEVKYTTFPPNELKIAPLNRQIEMTGAELFAKLQLEANNLRKEKKRNTYSGIHKYLYLIEGKPAFPCLVNEAGTVISFPPITNAEITKIEPSTTQMFVEVTSSESLQSCKTVLSTFLRETVSLVGPNMEVQQVKILDESRKLKIVFPAKNDLLFEKNVGIKVIRET